MICEKCGKENKDSSKFCINCGNKLSSNDDKENNNKKNNIMIFLIIGLIVVIIGMVVYSQVMVPANENSTNTTTTLEDTSFEKSSNNNAPVKSNTNSRVNNNPGYTYHGGVPFNIPGGYTLQYSSSEEYKYESTDGRTLSICVYDQSVTAATMANYMNNEGYNYRYDSSRNLYYLVHPTMHSYIYNYNNKVVFIITNDLDDLHTVYVG